MEYFVHIAEDVELYVYGVEALPEEARQQILDACSRDLAQNADHFLQHHPAAHESYGFEYEYAFVSGDLIYSFRFLADGSHMASGVVQVVYADYDTMPVSS